MKLPPISALPRNPVHWPRASRLLPARYQAADCLERIQDPGDAASPAVLARLAGLSSASGGADLLDPAQILFGPGAGWINASFICPRPGRFSSGRQGAFYLAEELDTALAEVRHHLEADYRREGVTQALDLDYRALQVQFRGECHDLRPLPVTRRPWAALLDPGGYAAGQSFAAALRAVGSPGLVYPSVRQPGGTCAAVFDPNLLRACRHDTYLTFRWNGRMVNQIYEKRILTLRA